MDGGEKVLWKSSCASLESQFSVFTLSLRVLCSSKIVRLKLVYMNCTYSCTIYRDIIRIEDTYLLNLHEVFLESSLQKFFFASNWGSTYVISAKHRLTELVRIKTKKLANRLQYLVTMIFTVIKKLFENIGFLMLSILSLPFLFASMYLLFICTYVHKITRGSRKIYGEAKAIKHTYTYSPFPGLKTVDINPAWEGDWIPLVLPGPPSDPSLYIGHGMDLLLVFVHRSFTWKYTYLFVGRFQLLYIAFYQEHGSVYNT